MTTLIHADALTALKTLPTASVHMCITSPPYFGHRDYGFDGQLGNEATLPEYLANLCAVFDEVARVLRPDGTIFVNIGDTYQDKQLLLVPALFAAAMKERGWLLRNDIIWKKRNPVPTSAKDRFTVDFEHIYFFARRHKYYFEQQEEPAVSTERPGPKAGQNLHNWIPRGQRNRRTVWDVKPGPYLSGHPAPFPEALVEIPIRAGSPSGGTVLDIFMGSGTVAVVANRLGRNAIGIDANATYLASAFKRLSY